MPQTSTVLPCALWTWYPTEAVTQQSLLREALGLATLTGSPPEPGGGNWNPKTDIPSVHVFSPSPTEFLLN